MNSCLIPLQIVRGLDEPDMPVLDPYFQDFKSAQSPQGTPMALLSFLVADLPTRDPPEVTRA
jgi:hypothetical protein